MLKYFSQGFLLGLAYVAPIGMQNLYVINTAISKPKIRAYQVALITTFFDISLALACFFGIGTLMEKTKTLKLIILFMGSIAVVYIGMQLIRSKPDTKKEVDLNKSILQIIMTCFMVTWLNPQAIIDGSLLLGSFRVSLPHEASTLFIVGVCTASFSWFTGITTIVSIFKNNFNDKIIRTINLVCGTIIVYYGLKLAYGLLLILLQS
ncbi:L-lysine permease [Fervidicella metallireducens AeB]|uniref:L-lysine permease n=1 Tax=Fervidicella metallireducens AeB TaxID=1403537 RepID=A0A017RWX0_9CLOT|nr:LysE family transporter [Fervidicella metallireducens]EYE88904.1 L-lysine permease [Fervidicella metallireducens AeB]